MYQEWHVTFAINRSGTRVIFRGTSPPYIKVWRIKTMPFAIRNLTGLLNITGAPEAACITLVSDEVRYEVGFTVKRLVFFYHWFRRLMLRLWFDMKNVLTPKKIYTQIKDSISFSVLLTNNYPDHFYHEFRRKTSYWLMTFIPLYLICIHACSRCICIFIGCFHSMRRV